jgi:hypothetical protein
MLSRKAGRLELELTWYTECPLTLPVFADPLYALQLMQTRMAIRLHYPHLFRNHQAHRRHLWLLMVTDLNPSLILIFNHPTVIQISPRWLVQQACR